MHGHLTAPIPVAEVPSSVRALVVRGMAKDPHDRPENARAFLEELEAAALSAYGPEWEQRGRRHLAELATLLALAFPLAKPAPRASSSVAQTVLGRMGRVRRVRRPRLGPRTLAGLGVVTVAMTAGVIAANRPHDRLSADTIFTPPPSSAIIEGTPARRSQVPEPPEPSVGPSLSRGAAVGRPVPPSEDTDSVPVTFPSPVPSRTATPAPTGSRPQRPSPTPPTPTPTPKPTSTPTSTPTPKPTPTPTPKPPTPTPTRPPTPTPILTGTPPEPAHTVSGLRVVGIDSNGTTVAFRASTPADVVVTVMFAEGPTRDRLVQAPPQTSVLDGSSAYSHTVPHTFAAPACGQTLYRRVTVATSPRSSVGTSSRTQEVHGEPCSPPSVSITAFDGTTVGFLVRTSGTSPVTVRLGFAQKLDGAVTSGTRELELSGATEYAREVRGEFAEPPRCGEHVTRLVTISTVPSGDMPSRTVRIDLPSCAPEQDPDQARPRRGRGTPNGPPWTNPAPSEPVWTASCEVTKRAPAWRSMTGDTLAYWDAGY